MRKAALTLALVSSLGPSASFGQQSGDVLVSTANEWGGAGGVYTCAQWRAYLAMLYRLADPKKRGYIDEKNFAIIPKTSSVFASATFDYIDQSGKGRVSREEFLAFESPFFARFDKKHSCQVTSGELRAASGPTAQPEEKPPQIGAGHHGFGGGSGGALGGFGR